MSDDEASYEEGGSETALVVHDGSESPKKEKKKKDKKDKKDKKKKKDTDEAPASSAKPNPAPVEEPYVSPFKAWMHPPKKFREEGTKVIVPKVPEKTDCWRKTRHNFIMDNAPFYWHKVQGDFEVVVHVAGGFAKLYDKAGIMIRVDPENWMVTALEYFNDGLNHSTCITHDYTDWSLCPLEDDKRTPAGGVWICAKKVGNSYETFHSTNGIDWIQARQGMFHSDESVRVGIFCACPMGDSFSVTFDRYKLTPVT
eukprot:CAMPEP_0172451496 /NCGR_PEP_ID=MMETSP1065-20121228/9525_1 /TAXON_ID=265537 /ORGANISM="Amphiprora paludosa, Strain CCMP125" /LENGTH=254 /DNA_ID=CAMNT_0013203459 /DNA_START=150 /DNA_END=914 /DNA_ORIENTATION=-